MKSYLVTGIEYDFDDCDDVNLPNEFTIHVPNSVPTNQIANYVSDKISDITGFCVKGFGMVRK